MEVAFFPLSSLALPAFLAGTVVAAVGTTWVISILRRTSLCPRCSSITISVVPALSLHLFGRRVVSRWCPECGWEGLATLPGKPRTGGRRTPRVKVKFRWGVSPTPPTSFFRWKEGEAEAGPEPRGADAPDPSSDMGCPGVETEAQSGEDEPGSRPHH